MPIKAKKVNLNLNKNKVSTEMTFLPFDDTKWVTVPKIGLTTYRIKMKCRVSTKARHFQTLSTDTQSTSASKNNSASTKKNKSVDYGYNLEELEKQFDSLIKVENCLMKDDSMLCDVSNEDIEIESAFAREKSRSKKEKLFIVSKNDFVQKYNSKYIENIIHLSANELKTEIKNLINLYIIIAKAFHKKIANKKKSFLKYRMLYSKCSSKFLEMNKVLNELRLKESKPKVERLRPNLEVIKKECKLIKSAGSWDSETKAKEKLREILCRIGAKNENILNSSQRKYLKKIYVLHKHNVQLRLKKKK